MTAENCTATAVSANFVQQDGILVVNVQVIIIILKFISLLKVDLKKSG